MHIHAVMIHGAIRHGVKRTLHRSQLRTACFVLLTFSHQTWPAGSSTLVHSMARCLIYIITAYRTRVVSTGICPFNHHSWAAASTSIQPVPRLLLDQTLQKHVWASSFDWTALSCYQASLSNGNHSYGSICISMFSARIKPCKTGMLFEHTINQVTICKWLWSRL